MSHCQKVVALVQAAFQEVRMAEEATCKAVVLIFKGGGEYHDIDLVEVVWKVVTVILNCRFTASIAFHEILCSFWAGRSTGTASLKAKILHHLTTMMDEVLYTMFLNLHKLHDALYIDR